MPALTSKRIIYLYCYNCKGAETTFYVPLRYHQLTTTNFIVRDDATSTIYHVCRHPLSRHLTEAKKKLPSTQMKKMDFFAHEIFQIKPFASISLHFITLCLLSFSVCQISFCSSTFPKNIPKTRL